MGVRGRGRESDHLAAVPRFEGLPHRSRDRQLLGPWGRSPGHAPHQRRDAGAVGDQARRDRRSGAPGEGLPHHPGDGDRGGALRRPPDVLRGRLRPRVRAVPGQRRGRAAGRHRRHQGAHREPRAAHEPGRDEAHRARRLDRRPEAPGARAGDRVPAGRARHRGDLRPVRRLRRVRNGTVGALRRVRQLRAVRVPRWWQARHRSHGAYGAARTARRHRLARGQDQRPGGVERRLQDRPSRRSGLRSGPGDRARHALAHPGAAAVRRRADRGRRARGRPGRWLVGGRPRGSQGPPRQEARADRGPPGRVISDATRWRPT